MPSGRPRTITPGWISPVAPLSGRCRAIRRIPPWAGARTPLPASRVFTGERIFRLLKGTRIYAAAGGVVSTHADSSYGTCVKISHGGGLVTIYAHMLARADGIGDGVVVEQGQLIGYVGSTGRSIGNHLHFEANLNGTPVSVFDYL